MVIIFLPRSKNLLNYWLQSPSSVILEPPKIKSDTVSTVSTSISDEAMGLDAMIFVFWMLSFKLTFSLSSFTSPRGFLVPLHFLPYGWCHLHIWRYWYFSQQSWFQSMIHPAQNVTWHTLNVSYISQWQYTDLTYSFPNLGPLHCAMSSSNCCFLICIQTSQQASQVVWYSHLFKNFPQFIVIHTVKGFSVVKAQREKVAIANNCSKWR